MIQLVLLLVSVVQTPATDVAGVEVTWRVTRAIEARGDGAHDGTTDEHWKLRLVPSHGLGRLDREDRSSCLVDTRRRTLTWLDHGSKTRRSTAITDRPADLFEGVADQLTPLRTAFTPSLEPAEPLDGESAAWTVRFPDRVGDQWTARFAVEQRPAAETALWKTVMRWCTAFDLDRSLWLDGLVDALPGPVSRLEIIQTARHHRTTRRHELADVSQGPVDLGSFRAPETYEARPFDVADFVRIGSP